MARKVSIDEFKVWYESIKHRTWDRDWLYAQERTETNISHRRTLEVKYFYITLSFDTRDSGIFSISTKNENIFGHIWDDHDSVLTALESRMNKIEVKELP